jgi:hypothetical protein
MAALDLRPLSLGELLDRTFFLYRRYFLVFLGIAAVPYALVLVIGLLFALVIFALPGRGPGQSPALVAGAVVGGVLIFVAILAVLVAFLYSAGASVFAVSEIYAGRPASIRESFRLVRGKGWGILGIMLLSMVIVLAGFIGFIIPGFYLMCRIPVATAAAMVEDLGPGDAIRKSFQLTSGFAGRAALIYLLALALSYGIGMMLQLPFLVLMVFAAKQPQLALAGMALAQIGNLLGGLIVAPVHTIGFALFYYDLRVRKEALDLQMMMQALGPDPAPPPIAGGVPSMFGIDAP